MCLSLQEHDASRPKQTHPAKHVSPAHTRVIWVANRVAWRTPVLLYLQIGAYCAGSEHVEVKTRSWCARRHPPAIRRVQSETQWTASG